MFSLRIKIISVNAFDVIEKWFKAPYEYYEKRGFSFLFMTSNFPFPKETRLMFNKNRPVWVLLHFIDYRPLTPKPLGHSLLGISHTQDFWLPQTIAHAQNAWQYLRRKTRSTVARNSTVIKIKKRGREIDKFRLARVSSNHLHDSSSVGV